MTVFSNLALSDDAKTLSCEVQNMPVGALNAVRRATLEYVPSVAFDYHPTLDSFPECGIKITKNTSPLHNELLGSRLALTPVCMTENQLEDARLAVDANGQYSNILFELKKTNMSYDVQIASSGDLRFLGGNETKGDLKISQLFPACPVTGDHVSLTKLKPNPYGNRDVPGDEVELTCAARVGVGAEHARWCPVSACYFTNKIDPQAAEAHFQTWMEKQKERMDPDAIADNIDRMRTRFYALEAKRHFHKDPLTSEPNWFQFHVESECGLRAHSIVFYAFDTLIQRVRSVRLAIETRNTEKVSTFVATVNGSLSSRRLGGLLPNTSDAQNSLPQQSPSSMQTGLHHLIVKGEGHTLGNLIQCLVFERNFAHDGSLRDSAGWQLQSIGYEQPHPLEDCIVFRVKMADPKASIEAFMIDNLHHVEDTLRSFALDWIEFSKLHELGLRAVDRFVK